MNYFLLTLRALKKNIHSPEKYAARSTTETSYFVSGPFSSRKTAERAALVALGVFTCVSAQVYSRGELEVMLKQMRYPPGADAIIHRALLNSPAEA